MSSIITSRETNPNLTRKINLLVRRRQRVINERSMTKTILMLTGFAAILAAAIACFTPSSGTEERSRTQPAPTASPSR
jgi:hypothetical protein